MESRIAKVLRHSSFWNWCGNNYGSPCQISFTTTMPDILISVYIMEIDVSCKALMHSSINRYRGLISFEDGFLVDEKGISQASIDTLSIDSNS